MKNHRAGREVEAHAASGAEELGNEDSAERRAALRKSTGRPSSGYGYKSGASWCGVTRQAVRSASQSTCSAGKPSFSHLRTAHPDLRSRSAATCSAPPTSLMAKANGVSLFMGGSMRHKVAFCNNTESC